jgi:hypothetical protein
MYVAQVFRSKGHPNISIFIFFGIEHMGSLNTFVFNLSLSFFYIDTLDLLEFKKWGFCSPAFKNAVPLSYLSSLKNV